MDLARWVAPRLDDDTMAETAAVVRAELLRRLETLWGALSPWLDPAPDPDGVVVRPDPRLVTAALTCLRQLHQLYRLDQPRPAAQHAGDEPGEVLAKVLAELGDLEARRGGEG